LKEILKHIIFLIIHWMWGKDTICFIWTCVSTTTSV